MDFYTYFYQRYADLLLANIEFISKVVIPVLTRM